MQVVHALEALHVAGWIHRDVKPQNVLLERRGSSSAHALQATPTAVQHQSLLGGSAASQASSKQSSPTGGNVASVEYLCVLTDLGSCCEVADLKVCKPWTLAQECEGYCPDQNPVSGSYISATCKRAGLGRYMQAKFPSQECTSCG